MEVTNEGQVPEWEPEVEALPEVDAELPDDEAEEAAPEEEAEQEVAPEPEPKEYKNPQGRVRILERDKQILEGRLNTILDAISQYPQQAQQAAAERAEESVPDPERDPLGALMYRLNRIESRLDQSKQEQAWAAQEGSVNQQLAYADSLIRQTAQGNPQVFTAAVEYLSNIVQEQLEDEYPDKTEKERLQIFDQAIKREKLKMLASGKNPGEEYLKRAVRFGFRWNQKAEAPAPPSEPKKSQAREQIRKERDRDSRAASIGKVAGAAPKTPSNAKELAKMNEDQFSEWVDSSIKSGSLQSQSGKYGRGPRFADLLPGKGIRVG